MKCVTYKPILDYIHRKREGGKGGGRRGGKEGR